MPSTIRSAIDGCREKIQLAWLVRLRSFVVPLGARLARGAQAAALCAADQPSDGGARAVGVGWSDRKALDDYARSILGRVSALRRDRRFAGNRSWLFSHRPQFCGNADRVSPADAIGGDHSRR